MRLYSRVIEKSGCRQFGIGWGKREVVKTKKYSKKIEVLPFPSPFHILLLPAVI